MKIPTVSKEFLGWRNACEIEEMQGHRNDLSVQALLAYAFNAGRHTGRVETILEEWPGFRAFEAEVKKL